MNHPRRSSDEARRPASAAGAQALVASLLVLGGLAGCAARPPEVPQVDLPPPPAASERAEVAAPPVAAVPGPRMPGGTFVKPSDTVSAAVMNDPGPPAAPPATSNRGFEANVGGVRMFVQLIPTGWPLVVIIAGVLMVAGGTSLANRGHRRQARRH